MGLKFSEGRFIRGNRDFFFSQRNDKKKEVATLLNESMTTHKTRNIRARQREHIRKTREKGEREKEEHRRERRIRRDEICSRRKQTTNNQKQRNQRERRQREERDSEMRFQRRKQKQATKDNLF